MRFESGRVDTPQGTSGLRNVRETGDRQWMASCPAHDDKNPSLSITRTDGDKWLYHCFAGCDQAEVIDEIRAAQNGLRTDTTRERRDYVYHAADGTILYRVERMPDKTFRPRVFAEGSWAMRAGYPKGREIRVPYKLPALKAANTVYLCEGEKDADELSEALKRAGSNAAATCVPGGAKSWHKRYVEHFAGKDVTILPDNDEAGDGFARDAYADLSKVAVARIVRLPGLPEHGDVYDYLHAGGTIESITAMEGVAPNDYPDSNDAPETDELRAARMKREAAAAWETCCELAHDSDILARFEQFQRSAGVVGEGNIIRLIYLAITSRVLPRPVSFVVKGPSSGGKSYIIESTLKAFPENAYHVLTGMSEKALIYTDRDFRNRFLYVAEASGVNNDFQDYILRTLLSEHRIRYETVESVDGKLTPRTVEKDGPTGLMMATTRAYLHPENETRLLSLRVDDSPEHTRDVLLSIAGRGGQDADYSEWRALQTWIAGQDNRVVVPYAETLARMIPPVDLRIRRDFELLINAIKSHAILHQASREHVSDGPIVATLDDYAAVRRLVGDVMSAAVATRVPPQLRTIVSAVRKLLDDDDTPTNRRIAESTDFSKSQVSHWLKTAKGEGYLIDANEGQRGKAADFSVGLELPADQDLLPTTDTLRDRLQNESVRVSGVSRQGVKTTDLVHEKVSGRPPGPLPHDPDNSARKHTMSNDFKSIAGPGGADDAAGIDPLPSAGRSGHPDTLPKCSESVGSGHPTGRFAGHFEPPVEESYDSLMLRLAAGKIACQPVPRARAGHWALDDALDPGELRDIVRVEGVRTAVAMLKRLGVKDAHAVALEALRTGTEYEAVSAGMKVIEAQGFDPRPADNAEVDWRPVFTVEAEFVLRRIAELRRDRRTHEARALRDLLPDRDAWRDWTDTHAIPDAHVRHNALAYRASETLDYQVFILGAAM